jgi:hypothetical protein
MSFNQILYKYRYSSTPCTRLEDAGFNFFDPIDNLKGFTLYSALTPGGGQSCPGTFHYAYSSKTYKKTHKTGKPVKYFHQVGQLKDLALSDDDYEIFAKAVAGYNGSMGFWKEHTWAHILANTRKSTQYEKNAGKFSNKIDGACVSCAYSIDVRNVKYGLPYRTYIWEGEKAKDKNNDGEIKNIEANPNSVPPVLASNEEGWCFAYGEKEWMAGGTIKGDDGKIRSIIFTDYKDIAELDDSKQVDCK